MSEDTIGSETRSRNTRASEQQKLELIKYFEENPDAVRIANGSTGDLKSKQRIWIEIAHRLNLMEGTLKSTSKWAKYWNDIIIYTKCRAKNVISGKSKNDRAPTCVDRRILEITGHEHLLKKWLTCLDSCMIERRSNSNSDAGSIFGEDEVHQVSSSEHQSFRSNLHDGSESEVSLSISYRKKQQLKRKPHTCSSSCSCVDEPHKKKKVEANSENKNGYNELKELLKEIPDALNTLSTSFLTLSKAIKNVASALERQNH